MKYTTKVKSALALAMSLMVGASFAATNETVAIQKDGTDFESPAYTLGDKISAAAYHDDTAGTGWFVESVEDDESAISNRLDAAGGQMLWLNTDSHTLTNKFAGAADVNTAIAGGAKTGADYVGEVATYGGAYFETEVKFVASDDPKAGIAGGADATKFAIYAYHDDSNDSNPTNLVVFHAYYDPNDETLAENAYIGYTNEVFTSVNIDVTKYTKIRVDMKQIDVGGSPYNIFAIKVDDSEYLTSPLAYGETGCWLLTAEAADAQDVSSLNFKGTGEIDNVKVGQIVNETYEATLNGVKYASFATAAAALTSADAFVAFADGSITLADGQTYNIDTNGFAVAVSANSGYKAVYEDGVWKSVQEAQPEAMVITVAENVPTTNKFTTVAEAFAFAGTEGVSPATVTLLQNVAPASRLEVGAGTNIVFDLNGYTLTATGDAIKNCGTLMITNGTITAAGNVVYNAAPGASLTVNDGTYTSTGDMAFAIYRAANTTIIVHGGTITAQEACIGAYGQCGGNSTIIVDGGTLTSIDNAVIMTNGTNGDGGNTVTVTGGTLNGGITSAGYIACGIYIANADTLTFGGDAVINVTGGAGIVVRAGEATVGVNGGQINTTGNATGKVGDANVALPCAAIVYDTSAKYPGLVIENAGLEITGGTFVSDVSPCVQQIMAEGDDEVVTIPALVNGEPNPARFSDANADGVPEGYELVTDGETGLYKLQGKTYTVTFMNGEAEFAVSNDVPHGAVVAAPVPAPTKADDATYTYSFKEWQLGGVAYDFTTGVTSNFTLVADFTATEKPAPSAGYAENDEVNGVTISAAQADWLNSLYGEGKTYADKAAFAEALPATADIVKCYLLNCDPTVANAGGTLTVTAITVGTDVKVTVELARTGAAGAIKGTLKLFGTADLGTRFEALGDTEFTDDDFSKGTTTTATFTGSGAKFFKAVIE